MMKIEVIHNLFKLTVHRHTIRIILLLLLSLCTSIDLLIGQDVKQQLGVALKENANIKILVDDKPFDFPLELIKEELIDSIDIIKGDRAIKKYKAPEGVILIRTKNFSKPIILGKGSNDDNKPLFIIDDIVKGEAKIEEISPDDIEHIEVIKGERAIEEYKAPNGVILITTKKYSKRQKKKKNKK